MSIDRGPLLTDAGDGSPAGPNRFATAAWQAFGIEPDDDELAPGPSARPCLPSALDVDGLVVGSVTAAVASVHRVMVERGQRTSLPAVRLDGARLASSVQSDRHFRWEGHDVSAWAPLSRFWPTSDGWVRTHANYPHHAARLRALLGLAGDDPAEAAAAFRTWRSEELEEAAADAGAIVVAVRSADRWASHPQAAATASQPLLHLRRHGDALPRNWPPNGDRPLSGVRVLDLTRVIAGPVATRDLAFAGAEVLRVDAPQLPEIEWQHLDTGQGKRSSTLDLGFPADRYTVESLLSTADVVVTGYRPGALARFGLSAESVADRHPGLVVASVSAWGPAGPWRHRRGFDSIVQAVSGIAMAESKDGETPGAMPAQALDHAAGHLLAAGIMAALVRQRREGGTWEVGTSLARVAHELLLAPAPDDRAPADSPAPTTQTGTSPAGTMTVAAPVLTYDGAPSDYPVLSRPWGQDEPRWT